MPAMPIYILDVLGYMASSTLIYFLISIKKDLIAYEYRKVVHERERPSKVPASKPVRGCKFSACHLDIVI